ncbi:MAG: thiamine-binding protein [Firmicutes bacterium]|nr:thiamine-binding protein [Bacillota bacterium]
MAWGSVGFQVLPLVEGPKERVYSAVDRAIEVVERSGVKYQVGPLETVMEGEISELLDIVLRAQEAVRKTGVGTVITYVKIVNSEEPSTMEEKVAKYRAAGH